MPELSVKVGQSYDLAPTVFPIEVAIAEARRVLTIEEAQQLADELLLQAEIARDRLEGPYVQVQFDSDLRMGFDNRHYTYRDPRGTLQVGDMVFVPTKFGEKQATVSRLGRGAWNGPVKSVVAVREEL